MTNREKVIKGLEYCTTSNDCRPCIYWQSFDDTGCKVMKDALALLKEQKDIVRCKDCIHTEHCEIYAGWDGKHPDWFCADGERSGDDD